MTTLGSQSPADRRRDSYVRIRDIHSNAAIYCSDRLHDGWEASVIEHIGYRAELEIDDTEAGDIITADGEPVAYVDRGYTDHLEILAEAFPVALAAE